MADLVGTHSYQLDAKGRLSLPTKFRDAFGEGGYMTLGQDGCLFAFPREEWELRSRQVEAHPLTDAHARAYARMFFGNAEHVDLDSQGRMVVPQRLRASAGIGREAVVLGVRDRMEIWDRAMWDRYEQTHGGAYQAGFIKPGGEGGGQ